MARRIKEDPGVHRMRIADAAGKLFEAKGTENTSVSEIARAAGYSKATLYVYFKNKEEIIAYLVLSSMKMLKDCIFSALSGKKDYRDRYFDICHAMVSYQEKYSYYFSIVLDYINIDFDNSGCEESERETFMVGEEINSMLFSFINDGIKDGAFRKQSNVKSVIMTIWGMLSGLIQLASNKEQYILQEIRLSRKAFLDKGFQFLYGAIENTSADKEHKSDKNKKK